MYKWCMYVYIVYEKLHVYLYPCIHSVCMYFGYSYCSCEQLCTILTIYSAVNSIIGSRLEDIRAVADVIGSLKGSNRNDEPSADAGAMLVLFVV